MSDPNYFDGADERMKALEKPRRWCKCGHIEAVHFAIPCFRDGRTTAEDWKGGCHARRRKQMCTCTEFRPKRKWFKR